MDLTVEDAGDAHLPSLARLFEGAACDCYCRYLHFEGDKNAWLERCATAPEENRRELEAEIAGRVPRAAGIVAVSAGEVVGWAKLAPRAALPKLRRTSVYRALDLGDDDGVLSLGCLLVHPAWRGRGVAAALARGAVDVGRRRGARVVEAYPVQTTGRISPEEAYRGTTALFEAAGYEAVNVAAPSPSVPWEVATTPLYPVFRASCL